MAANPMALLGGVGVVALGVVGGIYATGTAKDNETEPTWHYLSQDSDYTNKITQSSGEYHDKYGKKYNLFLVGVTTSTVKGAEDNTKWWDWSYRKNYKPVQDKAEEGFSKSLIKDGTTLMNACAKAYGAGQTVTDGKITAGESTTGTKYKEEDVWKFCTPFGEKVKTISDMKASEESYTASTTYGGHDTNKTDLVSIKSTSKANKHFWSVKTEELKNAETGLTSGDTNEFKKLQNRLKGTGNDSAKLTLVETCEEAYKKTKNDGTNYPKADTGKFCSISGNELTQPA